MLFYFYLHVSLFTFPLRCVIMRFITMQVNFTSRAHLHFKHTAKRRQKMKNKLKYERPEITLIQWTTDDDIITTSGGGDLGDWDTDM